MLGMVIRMQHGVVIWLNGTPELLASHVVDQFGGINSRPLIFSSSHGKAQGESDKYRQPVEKLTTILEESRGSTVLGISSTPAV
ncbi:hypothetical protein ABBQ38_010762 [Trebouxia sp. C0009 RCD-2024]